VGRKGCQRGGERERSGEGLTIPKRAKGGDGECSDLDGTESMLAPTKGKKAVAHSDGGEAASERATVGRAAGKVNIVNGGENTHASLSTKKRIHCDWFSAKEERTLNIRGKCAARPPRNYSLRLRRKAEDALARARKRATVEGGSLFRPCATDTLRGVRPFTFETAEGKERHLPPAREAISTEKGADGTKRNAVVREGRPLNGRIKECTRISLEPWRSPKDDFACGSKSDVYVRGAITRGKESCGTATGT